jgi:predicted GIY-YIG superfamily endonuclease
MEHCYPGVYAIACTVNGKLYVGSARNIYDRWAAHRHTLRRSINGCRILQNAWSKYGEENFKFVVLERVDDLNNLISREQYYIDLLKPEYNIRKIANSSLGVKMPREAVRKVAEFNSKRVRSPEEREKHRQNRLGMKFSAEWCQNIRNRTFSASAKAKMSAAKKGKSPTLATEAAAKANQGKPRSEEVKAKIAETKRKQWAEKKAQGHQFNRNDKGQFC